MINPTQSYEKMYYNAKDEFLAYFRKLRNNISKMNDEEIHVSFETLLDKFYDVDTMSSIYFEMKGIDYVFDHDKKEDKDGRK